MEQVPKSLQGLKQYEALELEVVKASAGSGWKVGQKMNIKGTDLANGGTIGRAKDGKVPAIDFGKDGSISRESGEVVYKFKQFGIKTVAKGGNFFFAVQPDQKFQILQICTTKLMDLPPSFM